MILGSLCSNCDFLGSNLMNSVKWDMVEPRRSGSSTNFLQFEPAYKKSGWTALTKLNHCSSAWPGEVDQLSLRGSAHDKLWVLVKSQWALTLEAIETADRLYFVVISSTWPTSHRFSLQHGLINLKTGSTLKCRYALGLDFTRSNSLTLFCSLLHVHLSL